jgi:hypothetical protein
MPSVIFDKSRIFDGSPVDLLLMVEIPDRGLNDSIAGGNAAKRICAVFPVREQVLVRLFWIPGQFVRPGSKDY